MALKRLDNVMRKYCKEDETRELLLQAFKKLLTNGHLMLWDSLNQRQRKKIEDASVCYYIPWDVQFKDSVSTPCRPPVSSPVVLV